jgi:hypothetical protein
MLIALIACAYRASSCVRPDVTHSRANGVRAFAKIRHVSALISAASFEKRKGAVYIYGVCARWRSRQVMYVSRKIVIGDK